MAILELRGVDKSFGALEVLSRIDLDIEEGKITSVIGPNGAGKTTLFNVISGRFPASAGAILFKKRDITRMKAPEITLAGLARSFQITNIFKRLTVSENIFLAVQTKSPQRLSLFSPAKGLKEVGKKSNEILGRIGLQKWADVPAGQLSHGDQRHLEIGMTLATGPELLMLDEPTSGMSPAEAAQTMDLIKDLSRDFSIMLIEHNMDLVMNISDRIAVLNFGRKIAEGSPEEVADNPEVRRVYLGGV
ncbi:MAG: ABC transporter ATP-binding protein [Deltaproteobacteria bacterium]|nr:MAG: ABC transporter ATP-binding protein [Deltaproteobacteria bacterium]